MQRKLELAMVLDNTGSMGEVASWNPDGTYVTKLQTLKQASKDLVTILFGNETISDNIHVSVIPYDVDVNIGASHADWIQAPYVPQFYGFVSNRNYDSPPNALNDISDATPTAEETRFRTPLNAPSSCYDTVSTALAPMKFGLNDKNQLFAAFDTMVPTACTRINVGLMWGWFTLSPNWKGLFDSAQPALPEESSSALTKAMILMTDGINNVFTGASGTSNDNTTTLALCEAVKAQGITLYTVGFGSNVNSPLLQACASKPTYYWFAPTSEDLQQAFHAVADDILFNTIHLTE